MDPRFAHIRDWIFDLDNCLYPASTGLFALIDERMGAYVERLLGCGPEEARRVQKAHFHEHGTTLAGLMREHDVDPHDFLADVHDIPLDRVQASGWARSCLAFPADASSSPTATRLMPGGYSKRSACIGTSMICTTSMRAIFAPSRIPTATRCCASGSTSTRPMLCSRTTW